MTIDFTNVMKNKAAYLTEEEIDKMLTYSKDNDRNYMLLFSLYRTGRRVSEIVGSKPYTRVVGLRPIDIKQEEGLIEFCVLKKNPIRSVSKKGNVIDAQKLKELRILKEPKRKLFAVDSEYLNKLNNYIKKYGIGLTDRVFPITRQRVDALIKDIARECNIRRQDKQGNLHHKIHAHYFRHSFAIHTLKNNPDNPSALVHLKEMLDHSKIDVTMFYLQFLPEDIRKTINKTFNIEEV